MDGERERMAICSGYHSSVVSSALTALALASTPCDLLTFLTFLSSCEGGTGRHTPCRQSRARLTVGREREVGKEKIRSKAG